MFKALAQYSAPLDGLSPADFSDLSTFQIGLPPARVDILQQISGVTFEEAWPNRVKGMVDGVVEAPLISKKDLIRYKLAAGRGQDLEDVNVLTSLSTVPETSE